MWVRACLLLLFLTIGLGGCERDEIQAYQAPKDAPRIGLATAATPAAGARRPEMTWTVPKGWRQLPGERAMRVATFEATSGANTVEVAVSAFPGRAGGLLSNMNRWRGQLNLDPIAQDDVSEHLTPFSKGNLRGFVLDMIGRGGGNNNAPKRMIGAIIEDGVSMTWFVKAMDEPSKLDDHKASIVGFAQSFRLAGGANSASGGAGAGQGPSEGSAGHNHSDHAGWQIPAHWKPDSNPSTILMAAYDAKNAAGEVRITVTALKGDGGGVLPNINRWRNQLGLAPVARIDDQPTQRIGGQAMVVDLLAADDGSGARQRMVVATLPRQGNTLFIKMAGINEAVEKEKQAFEQLVLSSGSPHTHP